MTGMQDDRLFIPSWLKTMEGIILFFGAITGSVITLACLLFLGWGFLQRSASDLSQASLLQSLTGYVMFFVFLIAPAGGAFACIKALKNPQARWPFIAAISAGIIGAFIMLIFVGVGWSYFPDHPKTMGILMTIGTGALAALPFTVIAIKRLMTTL